MDILKTAIPILSYTLIVAFALSQLARWHWFFSLLSQFTLQYCAGALIFLPFLMLLNHNASLSIIMVIISLTAYIQTRLPMTDPWRFSPPEITEDQQTIKVAQYNKYYPNKPYDTLPQWVQDEDIGLLVMQEVLHKDIAPLEKSLLPLLPHTLPKDTKRPNAIMIFSRYEIENLDIRQVCQQHCETNGVRFEITPPGGQSITIYSIHTEAPVGIKRYKAHQEELSSMAQWIAQDDKENTLFIGDINTTAYSPAFKDMIKTSGLHYQHHGIMPQTTWPSFALFPFLKIQIDHILFSHSLKNNVIKKSKPHRSDHHSLIATFTVE